MEPEWGEAMGVPDGTSVDDVTRGSSTEYLPDGIPLLEVRCCLITILHYCNTHSCHWLSSCTALLLPMPAVLLFMQLL